MIEHFGRTKAGDDVHAIDISSSDLAVRILTYGAILNDVRLTGVDYPLTLGSPDIAAYQGPLSSFGALMGPVVNRMRDAKAMIGGSEYTFEKNQDGKHTRHSGRDASHKKVWEVTEQSDTSVTLKLSMPDGEAGFPGNRWVRAIYTVSGASLTMEVTAESDATTLFSYANHSYWALDPTPGYAGHVLTIPAGRYTEPDEELMPTGRVLHVEGSPYDARRGLTLAGNESQFFDLNYCFVEGDRTLTEVARLRGKSGVEMVMESTAPGLQAFDCATIEAPDFATNHNRPYGRYAGFALEAQRWPGATSHANFPKIEYGPGERFHQITRWSFTA
ncbi:MAG: aldose epimerase family protein [Pseudomonadota bacterium]